MIFCIVVRDISHWWVACTAIVPEAHFTLHGCGGHKLLVVLLYRFDLLLQVQAAPLTFPCLHTRKPELPSDEVDLQVEGGVQVE